MTHAHEHDATGTRSARDSNRHGADRPRGRVEPGSPTPDPSTPTPTKPDVVSAGQKLEEGRSEEDLDEEIAAAESQLVGEVQQHEGKIVESDEVEEALVKQIEEPDIGEGDEDAVGKRGKSDGAPGGEDWNQRTALPE